MADVRSLLRQQRAARRVEHPNAAYSDTGKLLCTLCHEPIKTESLWDQHLRSNSHRQKALDSRPSTHTSNNGHSEGPSNGAPQANKRKHDSDSDKDGDEVLVDADADAEAVRKKRSRTGMNAPARTGSDSSASSENAASKDNQNDKEAKQNLTPPSLLRRASATPSQGVELQIPSRPATPQHRDRASSGSTPLGPSPLVLEEGAESNHRQQNGGIPSAAATQKSQAVNEDEWAAFEADIAAVSAPFSEDAVISAPAMTADEHAAAARSEEEEREKRRLAAEKDMADEKEDATRALETEFEEMEELEARVRKLKERREALRAQEKVSSASGEANVIPPPPNETDKGAEDKGGDEDEDDEDDDDDDDDFMGFRYHS